MAAVVFLQRNAWILPLAFAVILGAVGFLAYRSVEASMMRDIETRLTGTRDAAEAAMLIWVQEAKANTRVHAADPRVASAIESLLEVARSAEDPRRELLAAPAQQDLRDRIQPALDEYGYLAYFAVAPGGLLVGSIEPYVGFQSVGVAELNETILGGETVLTPPRRADAVGLGDENETRSLVGSPVRNAEGRVIATFGFAIQPELEMARILTVARSGDSGETYAIDREGRLLSHSRFEPELRELGLIGPEQSSVMHVQVRDPGGDLRRGYEPELPLAARPFTRSAASAIAGERGVDSGGFRDYRGVDVVGAWAWVPGLDLGLLSELDLDEAYAGLYSLRLRFGSVFGLFVLGSAAMFLYSFVTVRLRRQVDEARELGRYRIETKIGRGGMGTVYLARHALLRRPTAIKVLDVEKAGSEGVARFEREVQITSALRHPNTVEIYDYGYTPDGTFYYAMEYLNGITVGECIEDDGPQNEARTLHLMRQTCGSLAEAHDAGLIHRDIKPSNVMICERGGLLDFVKVLDFGLVRELEQGRDAALTDVTSLTGTPLYMPPEAVRAPETLDARGDVYQLGQLAYFLITGRHVFQSATPMDVMLMHVSETPEAPSDVLDRPVSPALETLILACLAKKPDERPRDARDLLRRLESCNVGAAWTQADASRWWARFNEAHPPDSRHVPDATGSTPSAYSIDIADRLRGA